MKNGKRKVIAQIAGPGLVLAALLALVFSNAGIGRAQTNKASATPVATTAQATAAAPASPAHQPSAKGQHEGVKVHGHWTIEVRNPDGKLVSHTEFENALVQPDGATDLTGTLIGNYVPGGYRVDLASSTADAAGPCPARNNSFTSCLLVGSLTTPAPSGFSDFTSGCGFGSSVLNPITSTGPCFPLTITAPSVTGLFFNGTAVSASVTSITDVFLGPIVCQSTTMAPGAPTTTTSPISPNACAGGLYQAALEGFLTHATLPTPVTIAAAGQLISVNVQISFQ